VGRSHVPSLAPRRKAAGGSIKEEFVASNFSPERVRISREHILRFLDRPDLGGMYFLDAGCGSGLSSLAALEAGATRIVSFDVDPDSVKTTRRLRELRGNPGHWTVLEGSVLDPGFLGAIEPADIVYSRGVLHHTGAMWDAVRNAAALLKPGAFFYIALYLTTPRTPYWIAVKKRYNRASPIGKRCMEAHYIVRHTLLPMLVRFQNPLREIRTYSERRGVDYLTDVRDWLGGFPYEDATVQEVLLFGNRKLGLNLINIATSPTLVEYLFLKPT
jgi:SAM-dependent methyltransferase